MRGLCPSVNPRLALYDRRSQAVNIMNGKTCIAAFPTFSAIAARVNGAEEGASEHHPAFRLENDRADVQPSQGAVCDTPLAIISVLDEHDPIFGCDPYLMRLF